MKASIFEDITQAEVSQAFKDKFVAVLDKPELKKANEFSSVLVSGWVIPPGDEYYEVVVEGEFGTLHIPPNTERPDVAKKIGAVPLKGQEVFNGFHAKIPFSEEISIGIKMGGVIVPWKALKASSADLDSLASIRDLLVHGEQAQKFNEFFTAELARASAEQLHRSIKIYRSDSLNGANLSDPEREKFTEFVEFLSSPYFLGQVLEGTRVNGENIPSPFSSSRSVLVGGVFNQINFLIFECKGERFYIGQYLHSADFVYVPAKDFLFVLDNAIYNHAHLHEFIVFASRNAGAFSPSKGRSVGFCGVLVNGVSPYHFFYDCLPALYVVGQRGGLSSVESYYALNSRCYIDVNKLAGVSGRLSPITESELSLKSWGVGCDALCVAGVSYKSLKSVELTCMDHFLVATAQADVSLASRYKSLASSDLVVWIGISQQKRAWINQKEALIEVLLRLAKKYKKISIIFDGMTADIFGCVDGKDFSEDAFVVSEIRDSLPTDITSYSLVGCGSLEKIYAASMSHFFISNYSTGSMYPARFFGLPGVAHLSSSMLEIVKNMHIHTNTQLVPAQYVVDVPDESCSRVDFVSYRIDKDFFVDFVEGALASSVEA
ncbi:hypothetical protein ACNKH9_06270 [Metapseudomonas otitidis]|uniref:hypothetical protein n=1 Tax=Metapseudomonas otitidis TaxID=319939 RepID=UPI003A85D6B8